MIIYKYKPLMMGHIIGGETVAFSNVKCVKTEEILYA